MMDNLNMSDAVRMGNGALILLSAILTIASSGWIWFMVLVGAVIAQSAFTGFCPMTMLFNKLGLFSGK